MIPLEDLLSQFEAAINDAKSVEAAEGGTDRDQGVVNGLIKGHELVSKYMDKKGYLND